VVTKIGGVVLDQIDELALSLSFHNRVSLSSLIYGAGPYLNEITEPEGAIPDYVLGIFVTSEYVLSSNELS
jgi:acetylglutamate kinase